MTTDERAEVASPWGMSMGGPSIPVLTVGERQSGSFVKRTTAVANS